MTLSEISKHISEREHWKKGVEWWAENLGESVETIEKALGMESDTQTNANERVKQRVEEAGVKESFQEFLERHDIDEEDVTNVWFKEKASGTYFSVETRKYKDDEPDFDVSEAFREEIREYKPPHYELPKLVDEHKERAAIINLFDAHLDKIASVDKTDKDASIESNEMLFESAFDELIESVAVKKPEKIIIPLGNDFWHTNDSRISTEWGTDMGRQVHETGMPAFRRGFKLLRRCIDKARQVAPVELIFIRGNHDNDRVLYLLECMLIAYEDQNDVTVHDSRKSRQYIRYGTWLFGWAHGNKERKAKDLPSLMSTDKQARKHWSEIKHGIYFLGDLHHEQRYDYRGCTVMYLRSAHQAEDEWHWEKGFTGIPKTAYAFIYDKDGSREREAKVHI